MNHTLNSKKYELIYVDEIPDDPSGVAFGMCDHPNTPKKKIYIKRGIEMPMLVEALVHECLHACFWCIDEEEVTAAGRDIARLLIRELQMEEAE